MIHVLEFPRQSIFSDFPNHQNVTSRLLEILPQKSYLRPGNCTAFKKKKFSCKLVDPAERLHVEKSAIGDGRKFTALPHIQTLRNFRKEELFRKVVMVRFDPVILIQHKGEHHSLLPDNAFATIKYLYEAGAKVILVGSWRGTSKSEFCSEACLSTESVADFLSSMLEIEVIPVKHASGCTHSNVEQNKNSAILLIENIFHLKGERSNCSKFSQELAYGVEIFVNDAFSESHKALSSTVGVTNFCYASIAGFYFEECVHKLEKIIKATERPYMAIISGNRLADKAAALRFLTSRCDGLLFVGHMAFQIMHALGIPVPVKLVEHEALKDAISIVESAKSRNIPLVLPTDIWCINEHIPEKMAIFSVDSILEGWQPVDIGPKSTQELFCLLSKCKKILWLGPMKFSSSKQEKGGMFELAEALTDLDCCDITFVGKTGLKSSLQKSKVQSIDGVLNSATVLWEVLKGRKLPGLMALDRAYPIQVDWSIVYHDSTKPLVIDVGSGNGLFLFGMSRKTKDMNFLGLEINAKLVDRCLDDVQRLDFQNVHFIATNATSTFRSIISSYPGELTLVSIQCPNPDFNKPEYRWRMLQRSLVEAICDMLMVGGKVFLQSDIEVVALRMKNEFFKYGKGKLVTEEQQSEDGWLEKNPFGVPSDWEQHVLDRDESMYRVLLSKMKI